MKGCGIFEAVKNISVLIGEVCLGCSVICGAFRGCIQVVRTEDAFVWKPDSRCRLCLLLYSVFISMLLIYISNTHFAENELAGIVLLGLMAGCLLFASVTDSLQCEVYQFTWWISGGAAILLWGYHMYYHNVSVVTGYSVIAKSAVTIELFLLLLCYILLQEMFFVGMYGRADCHAFSVCAVTECALGMDIRWYFLHMTLAFCLLTIVQALRCNIGSTGRLKCEAAFIPYITLSFWMVIILYVLKKV